MGSAKPCPALDNVKSGTLGAQNRVSMPPSEVGDIVLVHGPRLQRSVGVIRFGDRPHRRFATVVIVGEYSRMRELDSRQRSMSMHRVTHQGGGGNIRIASQPHFQIGADVARWMDLAHFSADHSPASFRLDAAHGSDGTGHAMSHAVAVRNLIEAIFR